MRTKLTDLSDEKVLEELFNEFNTAELLPKQVIDRLSQRPIEEMAQKA
jgi:hypothetical protein